MRKAAEGADWNSGKRADSLILPVLLEKNREVGRNMSTLSERIDFLKSLQPDFKVAGLKSQTRKPTEWLSINAIQKTDIEALFFRQQLDYEFILDLDKKTKEENETLYRETIKPALLRAGLNFECWDTSSKGLHVNIFFKQQIKNEQRELLIRALFDLQTISSLDSSFWTKSAQLVALEWQAHYKTGQPKSLIESFGEGLNTFSETNLLLKKREPTEEERIKVWSNLREYNNWNAEQIVEYIAKNNSWEDFDKEKTLKKGEDLDHRYKDKPNPNRPTEASFGQFKQTVQQQVDWLGFAVRFVKNVGVHYDSAKIWWLWDRNKLAWIMVDETDIMNLVDEALSNQPYTVQAKLRDQILEALKRAGRKNKPEQPKRSWLQFKNKVVDVETGETFDSTPKYFFTNPINWELGESEETPVMDKLFKDWVDEKHSQSLYEIIAYCLSPEYFIHIVVCLTGGGSNGKSTYLKIVHKFIGAHNITSTDLDTLINSRFETAKMFKKLVATMGETNFSTLSRTSLLKRLVGEDLIGGEFKNKAGFDFYNYAKIIIATNTLPVSEDRTRGFYRRWFLIDFPNEFPPDRDVFAEIPDAEYNNLARKCVNLLKKLRQQRRFTHEPDIETKTKDYEDRSNPINAFIKEKCVREIDAKVPFFELFDQYAIYLTQRRFRKQSKKEVSTVLEAEGFETRRGSAKRADGSETTWVYVLGLRFKQGLEAFDKQTEGE